MRIQKYFWYGLFVFHWVLIFYFWAYGSYALFSGGLSGILIAFGRLAGLSAAFMILIQFFFMGRMIWFERVFGLDKLARIHHINGNTGFLLLLLHPVLLTMGYAATSRVSLFSQLKDFIFNYEDVVWALFAIILFVVVVFASLYIVRKKMRYESWYFVHLIVYCAIFGSFWHQIAIGGTLLGNKIFYWYWIMLYTVVLGSHILFRFIRPVYLFYKHTFVIGSIQQESYNTMSIYIRGKNLKDFKIQAGQFMIMRFLQKKLWWQAHPFSLSKMPDGETLRVTIKSVGDFTNHINTLLSGTRVMIDGPYGVFTNFFSVSSRVLFIAGGIGITPIRSLMEEMLQKGKKAILLYGNRRREDMVFQGELSLLSRTYNVPITHVLSDDISPGGETGYIDEEKIKRLVPDVAVRDVYLCGPPPMMEKVIQSLRNLGVPKPQIHYEKFSLHG